VGEKVVGIVAMEMMEEEGLFVCWRWRKGMESR
jgi:hypothetical protein